MNRYLIRFNKTRGQPGRGSLEHAWRVFENDHEFLVKHLKIEVPCYDAISQDMVGNDDWNICCHGVMTLDKLTSTAIITEK